MGFFKAEDASLEFYNQLTNKWGVKAEFVMPFLSQYKKEISKLYKSGKKRINFIAKFDSGIASELNGEDGYAFQLDLTLLEQACVAYKRDLMRGKHRGTNIEKMIWLILVVKNEEVSGFDKLLARHIMDNYGKYIGDYMGMFA